MRDVAPMNAIAIIHQSALSLPKKERAGLHTEPWRLRNWNDHPLDPGWEEGRYCRCHRAFRNASTRQAGEFVVDCVRDEETNKSGYAIRSYFQISEIEACRETTGKDLRFASYYFCDGKPSRLRRAIRPRGLRLTPSEWHRLKANPSYKEYGCSTSTRPHSVDKADWKLSVSKRRGRRAGCPHWCP